MHLERVKYFLFKDNSIGSSDLSIESISKIVDDIIVRKERSISKIKVRLDFESEARVTRPRIESSDWTWFEHRLYVHAIRRAAIYAQIHVRDM